MNNSGYLIISLDFELLWGVFDVINHQEKVKYFQETRRVIPLILKEFEDREIHATWAVVGMLFNKDWNEWKKNIPPVLPEYENGKLSAYNFGNEIKRQGLEQMVFAPELIDQIKRAKGQELGTHTYSHFYCLEAGQELEHFRADLEKAVFVANERGITLKSLVFPRNQLREEYLKVCAELGIENVRSNPVSWYWKDATSEAFLNKLARSGDAYLPLGKKAYKLNEVRKRKDVPVEQKASRFLRPVEGNNFLRSLKLSRIKREMEEAARNKEIYHLWWHPHNFGGNPVESMKDLKEILAHFVNCRKKYGFKSLNMHELNQVLT